MRARRQSTKAKARNGLTKMKSRKRIKKVTTKSRMKKKMARRSPKIKPRNRLTKVKAATSLIPRMQTIVKTKKRIIQMKKDRSLKKTKKKELMKKKIIKMTKKMTMKELMILMKNTIKKMTKLSQEMLTVIMAMLPKIYCGIHLHNGTWRITRMWVLKSFTVRVSYLLMITSTIITQKTCHLAVKSQSMEATVRFLEEETSM